MSIIKRQILYPGKRDLGELEPETKLVYHFETAVVHRKDRTEPVVIDDSRRMTKGQPVETIYGKQFKLPIWESCLSSMRKGEICKLTVRDDPVTHYICLNYVITSKCFRKFYRIEPTSESDGPCITAQTSAVDKTHGDHNHSHDDRHAHSDQKRNDHQHQHRHSLSSSSTISNSSSGSSPPRISASSGHNCSMSIRDSPYKDLNELISNPPEIFEFTFELVDAIPPKSYTKDIWQMSDEEKVDMLPKYREDGNKYYNDCDYEKAVSSYSKGLSALESLMLKEKPGDSDWRRLDDMKKPFLLNLSQVKLNQSEYYDCIKYTDEVLRRDPDNIKALFRRAKAHAAVWNLNEAREDFHRCLQMDRTMARTVTKCLQDLDHREAIKNKEDRERFGRMFLNAKQ